jgi:predicted NBD/HSP70 family sugar kinase
MRKIDLTNFQVATSETARQINRRIALNFIRRHHPMSRADLARRSGLQRSTVSAIVDQLIDEGWVTEGAVGHAPRGRRPRFLHLNVERAGILAVELRPETTTVGLGGVDARFVEQTSWPTPHTPEAFVRRLARTIATMRRAHPRVVCEGVGISLPGRVSADGRLVFAPNLRWGDVNLATLIESAVGLPVVLENAANACALAELWFGRHPENIRHLLAVTVSEGIGVGLLVNGQLLHGGHAMAGEFGHVTIDEQGPPCPCGKRGCWERYASNSAAVQHYVHGPSSEVAEIPRFEDLLRFADHGDGRAIQALERMARFLGFGLAGLATGLAPEVIVMIGEMTAAWGRLGPIVLDEVKKRSLPHIDTRIVPTDPSTQPRLRGAVTLVVQQHFGAPTVA